MAHELALRFGNSDFSKLPLWDLFLFTVKHHDEGWKFVDAEIGFDPKTGLPYNLVQTPLSDLLITGPKSAEFNEQHHPYCGLLTSMHVWGLYNGRYGFSDKIVVNSLSKEAKEQACKMLDEELRRQDRLKHALSSTPLYTKYLTEDQLLRSYKTLQFFDTLSLYFNESLACQRVATTFKHVPKSLQEDATITMTPLGGQRYHLTPYPFSEDEFTIFQTTTDVKQRRPGDNRPFDMPPTNSTSELITISKFN